jgi:hypothetical protein
MFPTDFSSELSLLKAVNNLVTRVTAPVDAGQTALSVASTTGFPASGVFSIDQEVIAYDGIDTSGASPVFQNLVRGFDGTVADAHSSNSLVEYRWVAAHHNVLSLAIRTLEAVLGLGVPGDYATVAERLDKNEVVALPFTAVQDWSFTIDRNRLVAIQLYKHVGGDSYELFAAPITQTLNPNGTMAVAILLPEAVTGYAVVQ